MNRKDADAFVGKRVSVWTAANGCYVGTLVEITKDRPWRGKVLIDGVASPAVCYERGRGYRRGFRVGETIEVGGANLEPTDAVGVADYASLLDGQADGFEREHADYLAGRFGDPSDARLVRNYVWRREGAVAVRHAAARARREALPIGERLRVVRVPRGYEIDLGGHDHAVEDVLWSLPREAAAWYDRTRLAWTVSEVGGPVLADRLGSVAGEVASLVRTRLDALVDGAPAPSLT